MQLTVLDHIWANALASPERALLSPVPDLLGKVTQYPVFALSTTLEASSHKAIAAYADEELVAGASLADLLSVECNIDVPDEAIVYIETAALASYRNLGTARIANLMGQLVLKLATRSATGI